MVQDVVFRTDTVLFHKEKFYSPSQPQMSLASLPQGYHGQCGPGIKSLALVFSSGAQRSESKLAELCNRILRCARHANDGANRATFNQSAYDLRSFFCAQLVHI